jgi:hypothetical protein
MKFVNLLLVVALEIPLATGLMAQTAARSAGAPAASVHVNLSPQYRSYHSNLGTTGLPAGPSQLPYPVHHTVGNDALLRSNAWAAYNASLHPMVTPTAPNPNRLAPQQKLLDQNRFIEMPNSAHRYNFQFSDNEIRSVQAAMRRLGVYSGQVDGILGPDTRRAIADYQSKNRQPVTGQPDQSLNASLGIF